MKILRIGDPHVKVNNIDELDALMEFVCEIAVKEKIERIEILGDLFHNHSVLRLEVLEFWNHWLDTLSDICEVVVLVGNHDQSGDFNNHSNALSVFQRIKKQNLHIVEYAKVLGVYGYVPYIHDQGKFFEVANGLNGYGAKVLVCHQTFNGAKYENGFYAPDGIDPEKVNLPIIISGHIHATQEFGKVFYPGTPRWDTASDANQEKGVWIFDHAEDGSVVSKKRIDTSHVCSPIYSIVVNEGEDLPKIPEKARISVELVGSSDWVSKAKKTLKGQCSIKTKITDKGKFESRKAGNSLQDFITNHYQLPSGMVKERLVEFMKELGLV